MKPSKLLQFIKENYPQGSCVPELSDNVPDEVVQGILNATCRADAFKVSNGYAAHLEDSQYYRFVDRIYDEVTKTEGFEDAEYIEVQECIDKLGIVTSLSPEDAVNTEVHANVYLTDDYESGKGTIAEISDLSRLNNLLKNDDVDEYNESLGLICKTLNVNPWLIGEIAKKEGHIEDNHFPKKPDCSDVSAATDLFEEMENAPYGGSLVFTVRINLKEYMQNIDTYKERGITIPKRTCYGLHDVVRGSTGPLDAETNEDIVLRDFFVVNDDDMNGMGINDICMPPAEQMWRNSPSIVHTERESELIEKARSVLSCFREVFLGDCEAEDKLAIDVAARLFSRIRDTLEESALPKEGLDKESLLDYVLLDYRIKDNAALKNKIKDTCSNMLESFLDGDLSHDAVFTYIFSHEGVKSITQAAITRLTENGILENIASSIKVSQSSFRTEDDINRIFTNTFDKIMSNIPKHEDIIVPVIIVDKINDIVSNEINRARALTIAWHTGAIHDNEWIEKVEALCINAQDELESVEKDTASMSYPLNASAADFIAPNIYSLDMDG